MAKTSSIAQLAIMAPNTLAAEPAGVILMGITQNESLKVTNHLPTKIERDGYELINHKKLTITAETLQPSLYMYMTLLGYRGGNCDVQIIMNNGAVHKFIANTNPLGIEPTFIIDDTYRVIKVVLEASWPKAIWEAMELASATANAVVLANPQSGRDGTKRKKPSPIFTQSPSTVEMFSYYSKRSLEISPSVKSKSHKSTTNSWTLSLFDRLQVKAIFQTEDATQVNHYNQNAKGEFPELWLKDGNAGTYYDMIKFSANSLQQIVDYDNNESKSPLTATYQGLIPIEKFSLASGAVNVGDAVGGTGIEGGTLTVASL